LTKVIPWQHLWQQMTKLKSAFPVLTTAEQHFSAETNTSPARRFLSRPKLNFPDQLGSILSEAHGGFAHDAGNAVCVELPKTWH
jgi:hypothetical protein